MPQLDAPSRTWDPFRRPQRPNEPSSAPETPRERRRRRGRVRASGALLLVVLAFQLGRPELGLFAIYLVARAVELHGADGSLWLSTMGLWSTGVGTLLLFLRSQSWASVAEVSVVLFCMGAAGVGSRTHPGKMVWVLGLVALGAFFPPDGAPAIAMHVLLAIGLLCVTGMRIRARPDAVARKLARRVDGSFDLETREIRVFKGVDEFTGTVDSPGHQCRGPMPRRAAHVAAAVTMRACDCGACRAFDPRGETQTTRVEVDGRTVTIVRRGREPLVQSVDEAELRALLRQLSALPHGKAILAGGEIAVRAAGAPRRVREQGASAAADWSCRTGEQVFRLAFDLYDYLDRSATQAYR
jgi:hypothetical protein